MTPRNEPIAVVGSGCRFPGGASSPSKLWQLLNNPRDLTRKVPKDRFNVDAFYHPDGSHHGRTNARFAYFLDEDPYAFDPSFFSIPPNEVDTIDPQQRLLLETVFDGLSSAGLRMDALRGTDTAVYVGMMQRDFLDHQNYDLDALNIYAATGTSASILSNRVSYVFDWHGPSMTFDTACSSSLVAVHHAVEQLRTGASKVAVAAGSNLILGPVPFISASKLNMFSPNGRSRMWDIAADGYARGEGVASVVLKTLSQAIADGDPIECIIRESGINQDGKTPGITMPNHLAQENLIREVYKRAGLDVNKPEDRPNFFEAHGTGTPAGDPQEAEAISSAFFSKTTRVPGEDPLFVGSVKTIIGHTEGTAGIAGLMKASLILQHGVIPPNMLLDELSPRVAPFCKDLEVVTQQRPFPTPKPNQPRRVSVNSFGFGGTNAHVIVEAYEGSNTTPLTKASSPALAPIVLSAHSESSLIATMTGLKQCLVQQPELALEDIAWTLLKKRSNFQIRHFVLARTVEGLCEALERDAALVKGKQSLALTSDLRVKPQMIGIFTGQGAQWPAMGKTLLAGIPLARQIVSELDRSLQELPLKYRPSWSILEQLQLESDASNVYDAVFSQPLCCAAQIMLTQLLKSSGIEFKVVVGHSSGEIACAFAAGFVSASQAIRIAYLRGLTSKLASGTNGAEGAMLAAGTSFEDALDFCALESFQGRLQAAASNAPSSVTFSGDKEAILEAQEILNDESKFNRLLKVDKAYHSHHMRPCAEPYVSALKECGCDEFHLDKASQATWISSVFEGKVMQPGDLRAEYWKDNLLSPVLFSFALEQALVKYMPFDGCLEVGPHAALKGPSLQTIEACTGAALPYFGSMERGKDNIESLSSCLGSIWSHFGSPAVDVDGLYSSLGLSSCDLSKRLPAYAFDHSRSYKKESRALRTWLNGGGEQPHLLLGKRLPHSSPSSVIWQNFIRPRDIEWIDGHSLQGQIVFPGAGYVVMAMEGAIKLADAGREVQLLEVLDLKIDKAVSFENENSMIELDLTLTVDTKQASEDYAVYRFVINSCLARESGLTSSAAGTVAISYGAGSHETLPLPQAEPPHLNNVSIDRFYSMLDELGYGYTKQFRGVSSLRRGDSKAVGTIDFHRLADNYRNMVMHPATLDVAFQSFIGAYTAPGDRRLRSLLVPTGIGRIALNPWVCDQNHVLSNQVSFVSTSAASVGNTVEGDIEVFDPETNATMLHIEGLSFKPFSPPSAADDHEMFSKWDWAQLHPDSLLNEDKYRATEQDRKDVAVIERITYWYIKSYLASLTPQDRENAAFHFKKHIVWCEYIMVESRAGRSVWYEASWDNDCPAIIEELIQENHEHPFVRLVQRVGEGALETLRNNTNAFDLMDHDGLLTEFYGGTVSYGHSYNYYQTMLEQINHRYQNLDVLEIGSGTGGATRWFLNDEKLSFNSYTFTDISSAFFESAAKEFQKHEEKMDFRPLDIRRDPSQQDLKPGSYDLIIASNVLHATPRLQETLTNVRSLLKPGGRLIVIEVTHREHSRIGWIFGLFPDWWAGHDEGRVLEPFITYDRWDDLLKKCGFSGVDTRTADPDSAVFPNGVFTSHAVDELVQRLDSPLTAPAHESYAPLVAIGGSSAKSAPILEQFTYSLAGRREVQSVASIREFIDFDYSPGSTIVVISELDQHTFAQLDDEILDALQTIFNAAKNVLWVTESAWVENPQQAQTIGLLRTLRMEYPDVQLQVIDTDKAENLQLDFLAKTILRLEDGADWQDRGLLWTQEPELYLRNGQVIVPRLKPDTAKNNRLNSGRRPILAELHAQRETLRLGYDGKEPYFQFLEDRFVPRIVNESVTTIQVEYSLPKAIRIGQLGYFYLVQGKPVGSEGTVVALTSTNASFVEVPSSQLVSVKDSEKLDAISAALVAQALLSDLAAESSVAIFEPPSSYIKSLINKASAADVDLTFLSAQAKPAMDEIRWIQLHEKETQRNLRRKLSASTSIFCDLTADQNPAGLSNRVKGLLSPACSIRHNEFLFQNQATRLTTHSASKATEYLVDAVQAAAELGVHDDNAITISGTEILNLGQTPAIDSVLDWKSSQTIPSRIRSIETEQTFVDSKTYLLVGLAGDLGRSIARFMIEHGARHVVLTSRSPNIDQRWIDDMTLLGGNIMVLPMDISKESSVDDGLATVRASMPPIGGVAFGPLVLQDVMFKNMDLSMLEMVLAPKVEGARLLNERLSDPAKPLDFFVMFSSFVMVSGNPGQAAYSAANAFTHALAQQRRARGMAASTIDIGAVFGVGFIARAGREHEYDVVKFIFDEVNEWELHALFAEAVVTGRNKHLNDVEVITGMPYMDPGNAERIPYFDDPRFAYFKLSDRHTRGDDAAGAVGSVKDQLLKAETFDHVKTVILEGLGVRVRSALQLTGADELSLTTPLIDQGVDSLSAVTVGSWFTKNLSIDIPLLKILGGASINDLVEEAVSRLTAEAIPLAHDAEALSKGPSDPAAVPEVVPTEAPSSGDSSSDSIFSGDYDHASTPLSSQEITDNPFEKEVPLSVAQEYSWKQQQLPLDPATFNSTIGIYMQGALDLRRLAWAFNQSLQRHDALRTCFISNKDAADSPQQPLQAVLRSPNVSFEARKVADKAEAEQEFKALEQYQYDLAKGDTRKIVDFHWSPTDHLLIMAYHRLVGDGWTTERLFVEAGQLYAGAKLEPAPSYADFALRQRAQLDSGELAQDLEYWRTQFHIPAPSLPSLDVPGAIANGVVTTWKEHEVSARLNRMIAVRIKDRSRKHKVSPMHYYLASFQVLLGRLTGATDMVIGIADTARNTETDQATMGFFANLLPLRLGYAADQIFNQSLTAVKEQMRNALLHSAVPYGTILAALDLPEPSAAPHSQAPLFQAVFDYKQGQAESGSIGEAKIVDSRTPRAGSPYDVTLEMSDDPSKDPLITVKLCREKYGEMDADVVLDAYLSILSIFSRNPALRVEDGRLDQGAKARAA